MSQYFESHYISNSDLKKLKNKLNPDYEELANLDEIFALGSLIHAVLLEPFRILPAWSETKGLDGYCLVDGDKKYHYSVKEYEMARKMSETFMRDVLCSKLIMIHDFKREHEFYRSGVHGLPARCKMDGASKGLSTCLEYKGLAVATEKAFDEAIMRFDYDQGAAWYLDVSGYKQVLIVGISKSHPDRIFKRLIDRNHPYYKSGEEKVKEAVSLWNEYIGV